MKKWTLIMLLLSVLFACKDNSKTVEKAVEKTNSAAVVSDSAAIAENLHNFFKWYNAFETDSTKNINFLDEKGKHLKINELALKNFLSTFNKSGFVTEEFIANEFDFYKKCEVLWQKEIKGDVPSCLDSNRYYCAQDGEIEFWTMSPVRIKDLGNNRVLATLFSKEKDNTFERSYELKNEQGKWLLTKIACE